MYRFQGCCWFLCNRNSIPYHQLGCVYSFTRALHQHNGYIPISLLRVQHRGQSWKKRLCWKKEGAREKKREKQETQEENEQRKVVEERKYGWEEKKRGEPGRSRGRRDSSRELRQTDNLKKREQREDKKIREGTMIIKALEIAWSDWSIRKKSLFNVLTLWYRESKLFGEFYHDWLYLHFKASFEADRSKVLNQKMYQNSILFKMQFLTWCSVSLFSKYLQVNHILYWWQYIISSISSAEEWVMN